MLGRAVEGYGERVVEAVGRLQQHLRRLPLKESGEGAASEVGRLLVHHRDRDVPVHCRLHQPRDGAVWVVPQAVRHVEQEHVTRIVGERVRILERVVRLADGHDAVLGCRWRQRAPLLGRLLDLLRHGPGAVVVAAHEDGDGADKGVRRNLPRHHHARGEGFGVPHVVRGVSQHAQRDGLERLELEGVHPHPQDRVLLFKDTGHHFGRP